VGQFAAFLIIVALGDQSPRPPGIFRFETAPAERSMARRVVRPRLAFCGLQAPTALGSLPSGALSSGGAKGEIPVPVPGGVYRGEHGNGQFELVTCSVADDLTVLG
jgi:hypothetical protein